MSKEDENTFILNKIKEELEHIWITENIRCEGKYKPIKNTTKDQCYEAIYNIQQILRKNSLLKSY